MRHERSVKRTLIRDWLIRNVNELGMDAVKAEGERLWKLTVAEVRAATREPEEKVGGKT